MKENPIKGFHVDPARLRYIGRDLQRPECILAERDGTIWTSDARGGVVRISPGGEQKLIIQSYAEVFKDSPDTAARFGDRSMPNGLAFAKSGEILIANFGTGALEMMTRDGSTRIIYDTIDGKPLGRVNYILRDRKNRLWLTISTRREEKWWKAISPHAADGYIALADEKGLRIVADGLRFTNEIRFDPQEAHLYIVETTGRCVSRMRVASDGSLSNREVFGPTKLGDAGLPDGIAFDSFGNLWGTLVMTDQIFTITPDGDFHVLLDDNNREASRSFAQAFAEDRVTPEHLVAVGGRIAPCFSSLTFGGPDLSTVYIGSTRGTRIPYFQSPIAGLPMVYW